MLLVGGGLLLLAASAAVAITVTGNWPATFTLVRNAYSTVEQWAADRGEQIRRAFGVTVDTMKPEGSIRPVGISTDEWNARKIGLLNRAAQPRFRSFMAAAQAVARSHGKELMVWDSVRSLSRQWELYQKGRTKPGKIVTYTIASATGHIFGLAIDLVQRRSDGQPDFDASTPGWYYSQVLPLAAQHGLESLYVKKGIDPAHISIPAAEATVTASAAKQIRDDFPVA